MYLYGDYEGQLDEDEFLYEQYERTSDIQLPPVINILLFAIWLIIALIGFGIIFLGKNAVAGAVMIAVPTCIGMIIKPTFALCILMLVLPTGAGVGFREAFSLNRGIGIALAVSFFINLMITRPRLRIGNKALWVVVIYTIWISLVSLTGSYLRLELIRAFTQVQLLVLLFVVYWILETNDERTFIWALRSYIIGTLGSITLAFMTGAAIRAVEDAPEHRYSATLGETTDANMLATLAAMAFLAAIYLFARDKKIFWRILYVVAMLFLPVMLLKIGSRGALIALVFTMLSPLLFIRQVMRKPALAALLLVAILVASVSAGLIVRSRGLEAGVTTRLTDVDLAREALGYRISVSMQAVKSATVSPTGTTYYGWFARTGLRHLPHSDFFLALGLYGIPAGLLFALFMILIMLTVKRIPLGLEKLYSRAVLTFLLVMGLNVGQLYQKHFWVFLAFVMASERTAEFFAPARDELTDYVEYEEDLLPQHQMT
jgi:hypothetical protein